jgi:hypothetical protein
MRPCTAGQKRFGFRFSQIAQLTDAFSWSSRWLEAQISFADKHYDTPS